MKIGYTQKLLDMFDSQDFTNIIANSFSSITNALEEKVPKQEIPEKFEYYGLHSSFLVNFGSNLGLYLVIAGIIIGVSIIHKFSPQDGRVHKIAGATKKRFKWNIAITMFSTCYGNLILATSLDARSLHADGFLPIASIVICGIMNIVAIFVLVKMILVIKSVRAQQKTATKKTPRIRRVRLMTPTSWESYQVIFENYKSGHYFQQSFMLFFLIRLCLLNAIIGYLFDHPLTQAILLTVISAITLIFLLIARPCKEALDNAQHVAQEIIILACFSCVLYLGILDYKEISNPHLRETICDIIIYIIVAFSAVGTFFSLIRLIQTIKDLYRAIKIKLAERRLRKIELDQSKSQRFVPEQLNSQSSRDVIKFDETSNIWLMKNDLSVLQVGIAENRTNLNADSKSFSSSRWGASKRRQNLDLSILTPNRQLHKSSTQISDEITNNSTPPLISANSPLKPLSPPLVPDPSTPGDSLLGFIVQSNT